MCRVPVIIVLVVVVSVVVGLRVVVFSTNKCQLCNWFKGGSKMHIAAAAAAAAATLLLLLLLLLHNCVPNLIDHCVLEDSER